MRTTRYWLEAPDGPVLIGAWAVLIGRSADCNVVLPEAEISRHHALVRVGADGVELLPLGRKPVRVNQLDCSTLTPIRSGDRIEIGAWCFSVREEPCEDARADERAWFVERRSGLLFRVDKSVFMIGGGDDDLVVPTWESSVLSLNFARGVRPVLVARREGVRCGGEVAVGEPVELEDGSRFEYRAEGLTIRARPLDVAAETQRDARPRFAVLVLLEFLPRGGQLTVEIAGRLITTRLSDRRCDLVACLLKPPPPYAAGEVIPEEVICHRVWPGEQSGRVELNSLLYRLRQALSDEGVDPAPLFERRGGGLRFCLAPCARVVVR